MIQNNIITNFSDKEIAVLTAVDTLGSATVSQIAKKSGVTRTTVYNFIDGLVDSGLISHQTINGVKHYFAVNQSYSLMEGKSQGLAEKYAAFKILATREAIRKAVRGTLKAKSKQVDWMVGSPESTNYLGKRFIEKYIDDAFDDKVEVRTLRSPLTVPDHAYGSDKAVEEKGRNLRRAQSNLPFKTTVTISDDTLIFISPDHGGVGYEIADNALAESFRFMFNGLWKYAKVVGEEQFE